MLMRFAFLFFAVVQTSIFFFIRRYHSFPDSKWIFASAEAFAVVTTAIWYLHSKAPRTVPHRPQERIEPQSKALADSWEEEQRRLKNEIQKLEGLNELMHQRSRELETEQSALRDRMAGVERALEQARATIPPACATIQELTRGYEQLTTQIEQERRQHAVEVRALLRKENPSPLKEQALPTAPSTKMPSNPLTAVLLLLLNCQKGLRDGSAKEWPASEHRLLTRRKFFDSMRTLGAIPCAALSLDQPSEWCISPKVADTLPADILYSVLKEHREKLLSLRPFEPYYVRDSALLPEQWVVFRATWPPIDDVVLLTPAPETISLA